MEYNKLLELAKDLDDDWQCAGPIKNWSDEDKRAFIHKAAELAALVKEHFRKETQHGTR